MILEETASAEEVDISYNTVEKVTDFRYVVAKRMTDFILSLIGLIFLLPIFILIALAIKLDDSKGKVFFSQERIGKDGVPFRMYKFRSMYSDAEARLASLLEYNEVRGSMFKMKNDPRVTRVGRFIRKTSLDELPQLVNVLLGNMSLIGPRPALPREVTEYPDYAQQRLLVLPGISGLWQVSGRSALSFEEMIALDLEYIRSQSYWLDVKLLFRTIIVVVKGDNAY